jgi:hypothetical protein
MCIHCLGHLPPPPPHVLAGPVPSNSPIMLKRKYRR